MGSLPLMMVANFTLGFTACGGTSPSLSTAPFIILFISVDSPSLLSFLSITPVFSTGGSGLGALTSSSSVLLTSRDTWEFHFIRGAPLVGILVGHPTGQPGAVQDHAPSPLLTVSREGGQSNLSWPLRGFNHHLPDNVA